MIDNPASPIVDAESPQGYFHGKQLFSKLECCAFERECYERQKQLERLAEELARSNGELELFASMASHDLQEPLCTITTYLQLIERTKANSLDQDSRGYLKFTLDASKRLRDLIDDLLTYSRVGVKSSNFVTFKANVAVEEALTSLAGAIAESDARIEVEELPEICADSHRMVQLFENLISNAIKYHSGSVPLIRIGAERQADRWVFHVADNGIGIEKHFQERVFEMFRRLHGNEIPGTGIGLGICKKIVEQRGGKIGIESEPGKGSKFHFSVPDEFPC